MSLQNVVITNHQRLETAKQKFLADGPSKLQVLSDFDKTLTKCFVDGKKIASLISILRDEHFLAPDYAAQAQALFEKYHPIESDPSMPRNEKVRLMHKWWSTHYNLLVASGLRRQDIKTVVASKHIELRQGAAEFFKLLSDNNIPLVILSATGLGVDAVSIYLDRVGMSYPNIHVASNLLEWDIDGNFVGVREPIVHSFNKNYDTVKRFDFYPQVKHRKNILFLADSINDLQMLEGVDYDEVIKIGFLNDQIEERLPQFSEAFDVIVMNDDTMTYLNNLLPSFKMFSAEFDAVILNDGPLYFINSLLKDLAR